MWDRLGDVIYLSPALVLWAWCGAIAARRAGFSLWWGPLLLLPPFNIALIWVFAFAAWPNLPRISRPKEASTN